MAERYDHSAIEPKWQKRWEEERLYEIKDSGEGENYYSLVEFPYPSGNLHAGHWYAFSVPDIFARVKRMQGFNALLPIGFDSFGLPAENAAIQRKVNPREWTYGNIDYMRNQLKTMGASFDWSREVITSNPDYYRWTQWLFLKFFEKGLAYQAETTVNWCPSCKTVLANEQVVNGECERCKTAVEQKTMKQWLLKITDYAERLLSDLEELDWSESIKAAQRNWIGKSEGAEITFPIKDSDTEIKVFTTRPDTLFGATYMVLAPEHPLVEELSETIENIGEVRGYVEKSKRKTELERISETKDKTGVMLKGVSAVNPANKEEIPVFIADYVLAHYGTGAIMAVPAHDERDFAFAKKFNLPIRQVICENYPEPVCPVLDEAYLGEGYLVGSGKFDGMPAKEAIQAITEHVGGELKTIYKMRDWGVSRQRYWGAPIPIIHCEKCGSVPVPESELPVELPEISDFMPRDDGRSPLAKASDWVNTECPKCGGNAERETDTLDTFVDSSWYFLRYTDPKNDKEFASKDKLKTWMPVDMYSGGAEHTTMHVLYSRFFNKALFDMGLVPSKEPYVMRRNRGIILGPDGAKMSKSRGNVVDPDDYVKKLGADTVRMYLAFIGPYNEAGAYPWDPNGIQGVRRFLDKVWRMARNLTRTVSPETEAVVHKTIKKVGEDVVVFKFNTAVSALMICADALGKGVDKKSMQMFLTVLAPFAPHLADELWEHLGHTESIHKEKWPSYDEAKVKEDAVTIAVQVNGKTRATISVPSGADEGTVKKEALPAVKKWVSDEKVKRVIYVKNRLINIVV